MNKRVIKVSAWNRVPSGRYRVDGPASGEEFRETILEPALATYDIVEIDLSDVFGLSSSWLEEAFGGLVRVRGHEVTKLLSRLRFSGGRAMEEARARECILHAQ